MKTSLDCYEPTNECTQYMVHQSHKSTRRNVNPKDMTNHSHKIIFSFKSSFSFISFFHSNMMISIFKINSGKQTTSM